MNEKLTPAAGPRQAPVCADAAEVCLLAADHRNGVHSCERARLDQEELERGPEFTTPDPMEPLTNEYIAAAKTRLLHRFLTEGFEESHAAGVATAEYGRLHHWRVWFREIRSAASAGKQLALDVKSADHAPSH
ncbi:MAG TPA: hypothetical protein VF541_15570 [Longimicrobium sp.]